MAGFRDIFKDSRRRVYETRRQYDDRLRARLEAKAAAAKANRGRRAGRDPLAYAIGTSLFETGGYKRKVENPDGTPREETVYQTISQAMNANHVYIEAQRATDRMLDEAARAEYETALAHDEKLNDAAVDVFTRHGGHRATKFSRRLYRAWLAAQPRDRGAADAGTGFADDIDDRAAVLGGRTKKGRKRKWPLPRR